MKKLITVILSCLFFLAIVVNPILALSISKNVYDGAFDTKDYIVKDVYLRDIDVDDEIRSDYIYDKFLNGPVYEGGPYENIDRVYIDHPSYDERLSIYHEEELEHKFVYEDDEKRIYAKGTFNVTNLIRFELGSWEYFIESKLDNFTLTSIAGQPAIIKEKGSKTFMENPESGMNSSYSIDGYVLIDDENIGGCMFLEIRVSLGYKILAGGMGEGWEEQWEIFNEKEETFWYDVLIPKFEEYVQEVTDVNITLKRERVYQGKLGVVPTSEDIDNEQGNVNVDITTDADDTAGESFVSLPEAVVVAVLGATTAAAGAAAANNKDDKKDEDKKSRYRMCLRKDFNDAVRIGASPVTVYARIVEINENNEEIDRPDLTKMITFIKKEYLEIDDQQLVGNYMGATIYAPDEVGSAKPDQGSITIKFAGNEGGFTNNVVFRIIGDPYIDYPEQGDYLQMTLNLLFGDNDVYQTPFIPTDFLNKPDKIKINKTDEAPFAIEYEVNDDGNYLLKVNNQSTRPDKPIMQKQSFYINITAENEKEKAESTVLVDLYPEGLSISDVKIVDDKVQFMAFDNEETSEYGDVKPTRFNLHLVVKQIVNK
ncbi:MAG: hypothetical protein PHP11_07950, partial [Erysipelotrichaceae bacterium]|nr:hypothetical protein [Erysipelotrichaceae bacterium]